MRFSGVALFSLLRFLNLLIALVFITACGGQPSEDPDEAPPSEASPLSPAQINFPSGNTANFGNIKVSESISLQIQIHNNGQEQANSISVSGLEDDFEILDGSFPGTGGTCSSSLAPNASCNIVINYSPTAVENDNLSIALNYQNNNGPQSISLNLSGEGTLPDPPVITGLSSQATPSNNMSFNWDCNRNCDYRYVVNTNPSHDFGVSPYSSGNTSSHSSGNGNFYFHIQAYDTDFNLESAVESYSFVMDTNAPSAPSNLSFDLDATETSSSTLHWDAATDDIDISHYQLAIGTSSGATDIIDFTDVAGANSDKLNGLNIEDGIDYFTSVRAVDTAGNFGPAISSDAWRVPGPPEAIQSLAGTSALKNEITIGWSAPYHNGSAILDYIIEYREADPAGQDWILLADGQNTDTTAKISGLSPSTQYEFKVRAYNGSTSPDSNLLLLETAPDDPFFEPNVFQAMNLGGATKSIVVAYQDDTEIFVDDVSIGIIQSGERLEFDSALGNVIRADKEFFISGRLTLGTPGNTDVRRNGNIVWNSPDWAGKEFIFTGTRDPNHIISIYAFEDANVSIHRGANLEASHSLLKGEFHTFSLSNNGGFHMQSDGLIIAYMYSNAGGTNVTDPKPLLPASNDILGFPSTRAKIATATNATGLTLYHSDSHSSTHSINSGTEFNVNSRGDKNLYKGEALRIRGDQVIIANSNADSNGYCSAPFIPTSMLKKKYILNVDADYIAFASLEEGDITMEEPDGTLSTISLSRTGLDPLAPLKVRLSNIEAGTKFYSDVRFGAWYQPLGWTDSQSDDDETIMFGFD